MRRALLRLVLVSVLATSAASCSLVQDAYDDQASEDCGARSGNDQTVRNCRDGVERDRRKKDW